MIHRKQREIMNDDNHDDDDDDDKRGGKGVCYSFGLILFINASTTFLIEYT